MRTILRIGIETAGFQRELHHLAETCRALGAPTLIFRSGESDPHHTRATSERLHELIPGSRLVEPPWPDDEWIQRGRAAAEGTGALFERWPLLAPQLLEFAASR